MYRGNFCENLKCSKSLSNSIFCNKCFKKYCSNICLNNHIKENHLTNLTNVKPNDENNYSKKKSAELAESDPKNEADDELVIPNRSLFIKTGTYLNDIDNNDLYNIDNFELKTNNVLGTGSFGEVFLGINKIDKLKYAIKRIDKTKFTENGTNKSQILNEIEIQRRIIHENIIRLYSYTETDNYFYMISEIANKGTLYNVIKKTRGMDEKTAFGYFIQTVSAIQFLHSLDLVHRDLKPENLLIDECNNVKLCDFGWCVKLDDQPRNTFCGTYEYMAPEVVKEEPYSKAIDVWSLGVLLYEILHGYSPFRAKQTRGAETHKEIFNNITKYKYKIDKILTSSCKDLLNKLLLPDKLKRITIEDVFDHPWVLRYETEKKRALSVKTYKKPKFQSTNSLMPFSSYGENSLNTLNIQINAEKDKNFNYNNDKEGSKVDDGNNLKIINTCVEPLMSVNDKNDDNTNHTNNNNYNNRPNPFSPIENLDYMKVSQRIKREKMSSSKSLYSDMITKILNTEKKDDKIDIGDKSEKISNVFKKKIPMKKENVHNIFLEEIEETNEESKKNLIVISPESKAIDSKKDLKALQNLNNDSTSASQTQSNIKKNQPENNSASQNINNISEFDKTSNDNTIYNEFSIFTYKPSPDLKECKGDTDDLEDDIPKCKATNEKEVIAKVIDISPKENKEQHKDSKDNKYKNIQNLFPELSKAEIDEKNFINDNNEKKNKTNITNNNTNKTKKKSNTLIISNIPSSSTNTNTNTNTMIISDKDIKDNKDIPVVLTARNKEIKTEIINPTTPTMITNTNNIQLDKSKGRETNNSPNIIDKSRNNSNRDTLSCKEQVNKMTNKITNIIANNLEKKITLIEKNESKQINNVNANKFNNNSIANANNSNNNDCDQTIDLRDAYNRESRESKDISISTSILDFVIDKVKGKNKGERNIIVEEYTEQGMNKKHPSPFAKSSIKKNLLKAEVMSANVSPFKIFEKGNNKPNEPNENKSRNESSYAESSQSSPMERDKKSKYSESPNKNDQEFSLFNQSNYPNLLNVKNELKVSNRFISPEPKTKEQKLQKSQKDNDTTNDSNKNTSDKILYNPTTNKDNKVNNNSKSNMDINNYNINNNINMIKNNNNEPSRKNTTKSNGDYFRNQILLLDNNNNNNDNYNNEHDKVSVVSNTHTTSTTRNKSASPIKFNEINIINEYEKDKDAGKVKVIDKESVKEFSKEKLNLDNKKEKEKSSNDVEYSCRGNYKLKIVKKNEENKNRSVNFHKENKDLILDNKLELTKTKSSHYTEKLSSNNESQPQYQPKKEEEEDLSIFTRVINYMNPFG